MRVQCIQQHPLRMGIFCTATTTPLTASQWQGTSSHEKRKGIPDSGPSTHPPVRSATQRTSLDTLSIRILFPSSCAEHCENFWRTSGRHVCTRFSLYQMVTCRIVCGEFIIDREKRERGVKRASILRCTVCQWGALEGLL